MSRRNPVVEAFGQYIAPSVEGVPIGDDSEKFLADRLCHGNQLSALTYCLRNISLPFIHLPDDVKVVEYDSSLWKMRPHPTDGSIGHIQPCQRLFTSSCAIAAIIHPAWKRPFRFRRESQFRFASHEQSSGSGRFDQNSSRYCDGGRLGNTIDES